MSDEQTPSDTSTRRKRRPTGSRRKHDAITGQFVKKLTEDVIVKIETAIAAYAAPETACTLAGVSISTFRQWLATGRAWLDEHGDDELPIPEAVFALRVDRALAEQKAGLERVVGADSDWRSKAFMLERRFSKEWGKRDRVDIGNPEGEEFRLAGRDLSALSPDQLRALREILIVLAEAERGGEVIDMPRRREIGPGS